MKTKLYAAAITVLLLSSCGKTEYVEPTEQPQQKELPSAHEFTKNIPQYVEPTKSINLSEK